MLYHLVILTKLIALVANLNFKQGIISSDQQGKTNCSNLNKASVFIIVNVANVNSTPHVHCYTPFQWWCELLSHVLAWTAIVYVMLAAFCRCRVNIIAQKSIFIVHEINYGTIAQITILAMNETQLADIEFNNSVFVIISIYILIKSI